MLGKALHTSAAHLAPVLVHITPRPAHPSELFVFLRFFLREPTIWITPSSSGSTTRCTFSVHIPQCIVASGLILPIKLQLQPAPPKKVRLSNPAAASPISADRRKITHSHLLQSLIVQKSLRLPIFRLVAIATVLIIAHSRLQTTRLL